MNLMRRTIRHLNTLLSGEGPGVVVLTYHLVGARTRSPVDLPLDVFREHVAALQATGRVVSLDSALSMLTARSLPPVPVVVITFDDAYANFHEVAWPLLVDAGMPATLYVPCDFVDGRGRSPIRGLDLPACSWVQLRDMSANGLGIGSHTLSHSDLRRCPAAILEAEVRDSRRLLEERVGAPVDTFCYPRGLWSEAAERLVVGTYRSAVVSGGRRATLARWSPHRLERVPLRSDQVDVRPLLGVNVWLEERMAAVVRSWRS